MEGGVIVSFEWKLLGAFIIMMLMLAIVLLWLAWLKLVNWLDIKSKPLYVTIGIFPILLAIMFGIAFSI